MKDSFKTKEKYIDNSSAYPSYGRRLSPERDMNTFMLQGNLVHDKTPTKASAEPQLKPEVNQRTRIVSPQRMKFEKQFEKYMEIKHYETPMQNQRRQQSFEKPDFDNRTQPGTRNQTAIKN